MPKTTPKQTSKQIPKKYAKPYSKSSKFSVSQSSTVVTQVAVVKKNPQVSATLNAASADLVSKQGCMGAAKPEWIEKIEATHWPAIFLIGSMGAGKTTVGRLLAKYLNRQFIDSDAYIEAQTGASIAWIFEKEGEAGFRNREVHAIETLTRQRDVVLATGGGAILQEKNRQALQKRGVVIFLDASVEVQLKRLVNDSTRPLLQQADPKQILQDLAQIRAPLYRQTADLIVSTGHLYPKRMALDLLNKIQDYIHANPFLMAQKILNQTNAVRLP